MTALLRVTRSFIFLPEALSPNISRSGFIGRGSSPDFAVVSFPFKLCNQDLAVGTGSLEIHSLRMNVRLVRGDCSTVRITM